MSATFGSRWRCRGSGNTDIAEKLNTLNQWHHSFSVLVILPRLDADQYQRYGDPSATRTVPVMSCTSVSTPLASGWLSEYTGE
jgi:pantothenate kinase-related protein Tda10